MRPVGYLARLFAVPALLRLVATALQSLTLRDLVRLAVRDPAAFLRVVADPRTGLALVEQASRDPSVREVARAGLLFMPMRFALIGQALLWGVRRLAGGSATPRASGARPSR